jgi:hypothetical protein
MAATYQIVDPAVGQVNITNTGTLQLLPLGYLAIAYDTSTGSAGMGAGEFVYCQGSNVTAAGQFVHVSNGSAVLLASANSTCWWPIGLAAGNLSATSVFGWVQIHGKADYALHTNVSVAANAYIALASTAGQIGTVTALGSRINGIAIPNVYTSSQTSLTVYLAYPKGIGITGSN